MPVAGTLHDELATWCDSYVAAFSAFDVSAISAHWAFPAIIVMNARPGLLPSREAFDANTQSLLAFYTAQHVVKAERELLESFAIAPDAAAIRVADRMLDAAGNTIVEWQAGYSLVRTGEGWRAALAVADGELAAWAARGTPLGGKRTTQ